MNEEQNNVLEEREAPRSETEEASLQKRPTNSKRPVKKSGDKKSSDSSRPKRKKKKSGDGAGTQFLAVLIVFLAFYLVFSLFIAGLIFYSYNDTADSTEIYSLNVIYDENVLYKLDAQEVNTDYGLYLPFEYLSEIGSFGIAGDGDKATLFIIGTDNRIEFTKNSSLVTINDNPVRISSPILFQENEYLIPVVLIENYITGIEVAYDTEKMVCSVSSDLGKSDVALKLKLPEPHELPDCFTDEDRYYPMDDMSQ